ncbi:MAG: DUF3775 domain-containing protein [Alphaproteobacteria bacterium]|nr:MAG: DUF3775 domain-containing protein [Alphaproteobacteria bacterium]
MLDISLDKVAYIIAKAREYDVKVAAWDDGGEEDDTDAESILEDLSNDPTRSELAEFISGLNVDEQIGLVALAWIGRGSYGPDELSEALDTARRERTNKTEDYLLGIPLLADYLEEGLEKLGYSVEDVEGGLR